MFGGGLTELMRFAAGPKSEGSAFQKVFRVPVSLHFLAFDNPPKGNFTELPLFSFLLLFLCVVGSAEIPFSEKDFCLPLPFSYLPSEELQRVGGPQRFHPAVGQGLNAMRL